MDEIWKEVEEFPDYEVSNLGNVRSKITKKEVSKWKSYKYLRVTVGRKVMVHRLVAKAFVPNPDPKTKDRVNHKDGNPQNNVYTNLEWVTAKENVRHSLESGLRKSNNMVTVYDTQEDKVIEFLSVHDAAKFLKISDEAVLVWKVRSEYSAIDNRYVIKEVHSRSPKESTPLYVYDHVSDTYHSFSNRIEFVLNTGLSPYTVLEKLRRHKKEHHYIAGYTVSEKELSNIQRVSTAQDDRVKLFSNPPLKMVTPITIQLPDGTIKDYDSIQDMCKDYPYIQPSWVNVALSRIRGKNKTALVRGINLKDASSDVEFTKYNQYEIENSKLGVRTNTTVYDIQYPDKVVRVREPRGLAHKLGIHPAKVNSTFKLNQSVMTKDADGVDVVVTKLH